MSDAVRICAKCHTEYDARYDACPHCAGVRPAALFGRAASDTLQRVDRVGDRVAKGAQAAVRVTSAPIRILLVGVCVLAVVAAALIGTWLLTRSPVAGEWTAALHYLRDGYYLDTPVLASVRVGRNRMEIDTTPLGPSDSTYSQSVALGFEIVEEGQITLILPGGQRYDCEMWWNDRDSFEVRDPEGGLLEFARKGSHAEKVLTDVFMYGGVVEDRPEPPLVGVSELLSDKYATGRLVRVEGVITELTERTITNGDGEEVTVWGNVFEVCDVKKASSRLTVHSDLGPSDSVQVGIKVILRGAVDSTGVFQGEVIQFWTPN